MKKVILIIVAFFGIIGTISHQLQASLVFNFTPPANSVVMHNPPECMEAYAKSIGSMHEIERGYSIAVSESEKVLYVGGIKKDSLVILKINTKGKIEWTRTFDIVPNKTDHINAMFVDADGMLGIAGTSGSLVTGGTVFVLRYDPLLNLILWSIELKSSSNRFCSGMIEMGPGGNYLISNNPTSPNDAELIELDKATGKINMNFSRHYDLGSSETLSDLVFYQGKIYAAGRFTDGGSAAEMRNTLIKLDPVDGTPEWVSLGHLPPYVSARLYGVDLVIDQGQIYSISEGDANGTSLDITEIFIQKTNLNGGVDWIKKYDLPGSNDWLDEIIASDNGLVVLARSRVSPSDNILFKINHIGEVLWAKKFDFSQNDNSVLLGGITSQLIGLDNYIYFTSIAETGGEENMILVKTDLKGEINDTCGISASIEIKVTNVNSPTFYSVAPHVFSYVPEVVSHDIEPGVSSILPVENVCRSDNAISIEIEITICVGETYEGYDQTGTYTDTFITNEGCDSIRVLNLMVKMPEIDLMVNICTGENFEGYDQPGVFTDTIKGIGSQCDTLRNLTIMLLPTTTSSVAESICTGQNYFGYTITGIYTDTFQVTGGCDSVRLVNLTVSDVIMTSIDRIICSGDFFEGYQLGGIYFDTFQAIGGCDSIRELHLVQIDKVETRVNASICDDLPHSYSKPGEYIDTLISFRGCDSIITLEVSGVSHYIPNVFSPNDDGINDLFYTTFFPEEKIQLEYFAIFDRFGNMTYQTSEWPIIWNGKDSKNEPFHPEVYAYVFIYTCGTNRIIEHGDITLIK